MEPVLASGKLPLPHAAREARVPEMVDTETALGELMVRLGANSAIARCAVDTEADSLHCYREKLCLIQFATEEEEVLIDPLRIGDLAEFDQWLQGVEVWMHGADYDMTMLRRTFGRFPPRVLDTQIGARLIGMRKFGLAALVEEMFGVTLSKASQKADWSKRPLTEKMCDYAINDVRFLLPMADHLLVRLEELGRSDWFHQSCQAAIRDVQARPDQRDSDEAWKIQGWGQLEPRGLAYLREIWRWRDGEAERLDRPVFRIMNNKQLIAAAERLQAGQVVSPSSTWPIKRRRGFHEAVQRAELMAEEEYPGKKRGRRREKPKDLDARVNAAKRERDAVAEQLDLEASLLVSRVVLEDLIIEPHLMEERLMRWQMELVGEIIERHAWGRSPQVD